MMLTAKNSQSLLENIAGWRL